MDGKHTARRFGRPLLLLLAGALSGLTAKLFDLYTEILGAIFSQLSVWILIGVVISVYSRSPRRAALGVFAFCAGMLAAYYLTAEALGGVYGMTFIYGWSVFTLFCPLFAYAAWHTKEPGPLGKLLSAGILLVTLAAPPLLFDGLHFYDLIILALLAVLLFFVRVPRRGGTRHD